MHAHMCTKRARCQHAQHRQPGLCKPLVVLGACTRRSSSSSAARSSRSAAICARCDLFGLERKAPVRKRIGQPHDCLHAKDEKASYLAPQPLMLGLALVVRPQRCVAVALAPAGAETCLSCCSHVQPTATKCSYVPHNNCFQLCICRHRHTAPRDTIKRLVFVQPLEMCQRACAPPPPAACYTRTLVCCLACAFPACRGPYRRHLRPLPPQLPMRHQVIRGQVLIAAKDDEHRGMQS